MASALRHWVLKTAPEVRAAEQGGFTYEMVSEALRPEDLSSNSVSNDCLAFYLGRFSLFLKKSLLFVC